MEKTEVLCLKGQKKIIGKLSSSLKDYCMRCNEPLWNCENIKNGITNGIKM